MQGTKRNELCVFVLRSNKKKKKGLVHAINAVEKKVFQKTEEEKNKGGKDRKQSVTLPFFFVLLEKKLKRKRVHVVSQTHDRNNL